jgi:hypothetical protein
VITCDDPDDRSAQVKVSRVGLQLFVKGPTAVAVQSRVAELVASGAKQVSAVTASGAEFVAVCDEGSVGNLRHQW